ncbi:uncharacterized protein HD556DRAFT_1223852, partial [Suillus plorans]
MSSFTKTARVEQASASKPPFLTAGQITPEVLRSWEMGCMQFFLHKEVQEVEKVKKIAWGMQDPIVQDWYLNNQEEFDALTFREFVTHIHEYWLPTNWADTVRRKMLSSVQGQRPFSEWAVDIQSQNTLLRDTASHLDDVNLLYHLESHMNSDLAADYYAENIAEEDIRRWIEKVRLLDEKRLRYLTRQKDAVDTALRAERARAGLDKKIPFNPRSTNKPSTTQSNNTSSKPFVRLPPLSDIERQLLRDNDGCFKCWEPFAGHNSAACQNGFPDGSKYKALTAASIASKKSKQKTGVIAAVDVEDENSNTVAVVMPSAALGNGTDSGEECVAPLQTPHLRWNCLVDGPSVTSPVTVSALIDHGSALVLIGEELVAKLGLRRRKLHKPLPVSLAMSQNKTFLLSHYVKLACTSLDNCYTSRTVRAIIAPNLCTPLLLGGPFLQHNHIIVDHELRTCIPKNTNYDLLQDQRASLADKPARISASGPKLECKPVRQIDVVAAVQAKIENLVYQDSLKDLDARMKDEFKDRFPVDIPHNDTMPRDVLFRITLKDANKIVQQRSYDCPKKYRAAWK